MSVNLRIHFPSGESVRYLNIEDSELVNNSKHIGYVDDDAKVLFNKSIIAGYVITTVKEQKCLENS